MQEEQPGLQDVSIAFYNIDINIVLEHIQVCFRAVMAYWLKSQVVTQMSPD